MGLGNAHPNVILISIDSLRADYLGAMIQDGKNTLTPNLDQLTASSYLFSQCFSQGTTTHPAITALLTSTYPLDYGGHSYLNDSRPTIAEILRAEGYYTAAFHSNPFLSRLRNFHRGFHAFQENIISQGFAGLLEKVPAGFTERVVRKAYRIVRKQPYLPASQLNKQVIDSLTPDSNPLFLWIHYMDVHGPYLHHQGFSYYDKVRAEMVWRKAYKGDPTRVTDRERRHLLSGYESEIRYLDQHIGTLFDVLEERDLWNNSLIIITADHGEEFGEHGQYGHMNLPYNTLIHVPLIIKPPLGYEGENSVIRQRVRLLDVMPTILGFLGTQLRPEVKNQLAGQSLLPLLEGDNDEYEENDIITEKFVPQSEDRFERIDPDRIQASIIRDNWKLMLDKLNGKREFYDLSNDFDEKNDLISTHKDTAIELTSILESHLSKMLSKSRGVDPYEFEESEEVKKRLEDLGYM